MVECCICLEKIKFNQKIVACSCVNKVHLKCFREWLNSQETPTSRCIYCGVNGNLYIDKLDLSYSFPKIMKMCLCVNHGPTKKENS